MPIVSFGMGGGSLALFGEAILAVVTGDVSFGTGVLVTGLIVVVTLGDGDQ